MSEIVEARERSKLQQQQGPQNPLSEILRPQTLSDLTLPRPVIDRLQKMIETNSPINMLFYGRSWFRKDISGAPYSRIALR